MTNRDVLGLAGRLSEAGRPFAMASVVRRTAPSSARAGWRALVEADGTFHGWLGGACVEPTVVREAVEAIREGEPRLLVFAPDAEADRPGATVHPMTCHSGGTVEVYIEPELPAPRVTVFGDSPVSRAVAAMAAAAGFRVRAVGVEGAAAAYADAEVVEEPPVGADPSEAGEFALVATMGEWDERAARQALAAGADYVGLVASPKRAAQVREHLEAEGVEGLDRLVSPAGLDLGAREPGEIAITVLAEIVQRRRSGAARAAAAPGGAPDAPETATDPVCGMDVAVAGAEHTLEHEGTTHYFCCSACLESFAREPGRFLSA